MFDGCVNSDSNMTGRDTVSDYIIFEEDARLDTTREGGSLQYTHNLVLDGGRTRSGNREH